MMRSCNALVIPITLIGLHALSVETASTVWVRSLQPRGADHVLRPEHVRRDGFGREVLTRRDLLHRRRMEHHVGGDDGVVDAREVAHVADPELDQLIEVVVDDVVGRALGVLPARLHRILLRLVAREDDDLVRDPELTGEQTTHERLPERSGSARDQNGRAVPGRGSSPRDLVGRFLIRVLADHGVP